MKSALLFAFLLAGCAKEAEILGTDRLQCDEPKTELRDMPTDVCVKCTGDWCRKCDTFIEED